jgi:hypothetical protein
MRSTFSPRDQNIRGQGARSAAGGLHDLVSFFDQKLGGHFSQPIGRTGDENARHSEPSLAVLLI